MASPGFIHLHTHTEFSLLDGASRIPDLVSRAVEMEMPSLAITDHGNMFGNITFYSEAKSKGIKPILGCEVYVAPRTRHDKEGRLDKEQYHLVLLAEDESGYKNLIKLVSTAWQEGFYYKPRVDKELLSQYSKGLIALTACLGGEVPHFILQNNSAQAERSLGEYVDIFGKDNLYLELQEHYLPEQKPTNEAMISLAEKTGLKLVATNDIHYTNKADSEPHDVLLCIQTNSALDDPKRMRFGSQEFYMKSQEEMARLFGHIPEALAHTLEIADRCNIKFDFGRSMLPDPGIPVELTPDDFMVREAQAGLLAKMGGSISESYQKQFDYECGIINQCGFATYMLIVRDFTDFARKQGIHVGVRGSAAGSLVCYALGITDVDPIEYGLTFERFLNPERIEMPDVDLDIQDDRRDDLIQYVIDKYGKDRVGQIATFGSLKARAAVKDCGRVLGMELSDVNRISNMIPQTVGVTIDQAIEENPEMKAAYKGSAEIRRLIDTARSLEGLNRSVGVHAAGVLICKDPLTDHVPLHFGGKGEVVAQLAKKDIQKVGLLKMDFLGLANLTILANAVVNVKKSHGIDVDILDIPLDDAKTFEMLGRGDTNGVFQLESAGMRRNVVDLKPNSVRELAAIVALYRPGPMAFIPTFVRSKFGLTPITYLHPDLEPVLAETYGVICYQEHVLRIANVIAGFTMGQADVLRKAMSSKSKEVMDEQRTKFVEGAKNRGIDRKIADQIYDQIEPFAGYAFNKAHAVCYAFVAYRTAYMKSTYPVEYYAALLTANMDNKDNLAMYMDDTKRLGVHVLPPDVNASGCDFEVEDNAVRFGLAAVKGVGRGVVEAIAQIRQEDGPFTSLHEFCRRVNSSTVPQSAVECLIKIGAFDGINNNRAQLLFVLEDAVTSAARDQRDRRNGQGSLFDAMIAEDEPSYLEPTVLPQVTALSTDEMLAMEKDLLGIYVSDHPLMQYQEKLEKLVNVTSDQLKEKAEKEDVVVAGMVVRVKKITTRKNQLMAFATIEDLRGSIDVTIFPKLYEECIQHLIEDSIVLVRGKANRRERANGDEEGGEVGIICDSILPIATAFNGNGNGNGGPKAVNIKIGSLPRKDLVHLQTVLGAYPGENPVFFHVAQNGSTRRVSVEHRIDPSTRCLGELERLLGKEVVWVE